MLDLKPHIKKCLIEKLKDDPSFQEIKDMLDLFTDPTYSDVYETSLKVIQNID